MHVGFEPEHVGIVPVTGPVGLSMPTAAVEERKVTPTVFGKT